MLFYFIKVNEMIMKSIFILKFIFPNNIWQVHIIHLFVEFEICITF